MQFFLREIAREKRKGKGKREMEMDPCFGGIFSDRQSKSFFFGKEEFPPFRALRRRRRRGEKKEKEGRNGARDANFIFRLSLLPVFLRHFLKNRLKVAKTQCHKPLSPFLEVCGKTGNSPVVKNIFRGIYNMENSAPSLCKSSKV